MKKRVIIGFVFGCLFVSMLVGCSLKQVESDNKIEAFMNAFQEYSSHSYSGTVLVAKDGEIIYHQALGYANYENDITMETSHQFPIGSITKSMTAVAILQLQEQGLLDVNDSVGTYIDGFDEEITIHHLLTHTSGMQRDGMFLGREPVSLDDNVAYIKTKDLLFTVGEKFSYSNAGYNILAAIIEQVSKNTYNQYIEQYIFEKSNMTYSYGGEDASYGDNQAMGYRFDKGKPLKLDIYNLSSVLGSGNVYSTTEDMHKYIKAIKSNVLIDQESVTSMLSSHWQEENFNYGYGWEISNEEKITWYQHMGNIGNSGYVSSVLMSINPDYHLIFLTNNDNTTALNVVSDSIEAIILDEPYVLFEKPIEANNSESEISEFVGTYMLDVGLQIQVKYENDQLYATSETGDFHELIAIGKSKFHYKDLQWVTLEFDNDGDTQKIIIQNISNQFYGNKQ